MHIALFYRLNSVCATKKSQQAQKTSFGYQLLASPKEIVSTRGLQNAFAHHRLISALICSLLGVLCTWDPENSHSWDLDHFRTACKLVVASTPICLALQPSECTTGDAFTYIEAVD